MLKPSPVLSMRACGYLPPRSETECLQLKRPLLADSARAVARHRLNGLDQLFVLLWFHVARNRRIVTLRATGEDLAKLGLACLGTIVAVVAQAHLLQWALRKGRDREHAWLADRLELGKGLCCCVTRVRV